jgi:hypothetical protein
VKKVLLTAVLVAMCAPALWAAQRGVVAELFTSTT